MAHKINGSDTFSSLPSQVDLELLEALLEPEDANYPWNPGDEESEAYFQELEQQFGMEDLQGVELMRRSQDFYGHLDTLWSSITPTPDPNHNLQQAVVLNLQEILRTNFSACVPQILLNTIASKAAEIFAARQLISEQLVECVQTVLPAWGTEDLIVLARPFAYAMRSSESQNAASALTNLQNSEWTALSEVDKAKVSLAIASYAFTELNKSQSEV
ncbi:hypothetical protein [Nostoc sp. 'Peltigera malacea cyanobiont' DB3992]|uniref:hypothetical protein n=1 Tax=Nostoc sp. 'Peltigera malacea cyanobiont' DB3992 TaxID=1206980 RepID=UPI000C057A41|nr:hypothetical protein [Nostoc sp. 'Peltigera malacea cyanobiont' DB3992]PHM11100.1 hypothetical protein CK516_04535 [Nostoc sp. 'Peltigera malacea cyanobiont' DB3992]